MCGITAIVSLDTSQEVSSYEYSLQLEREITCSLDEISHRGPDARGSWISSDDRVGK
jgi:asparagine synthase (glutamine-hydrolysing)